MEPGLQITQAQTQAQRLVLGQALQQSVMMLQYDAVDLTSYLENLSLENPLFDVRSRLASGGEINLSGQIEGGQTKQISLFEHLLMQVQLTMRDTPLRQVVYQLIERIDTRGYLPEDIDKLEQELGIEKVVLADAITLVQQLDPPGVGARTLQECLLLQSRFESSEASKYASQILEEYYPLLLAHQFDQLRQRTHLSVDQMTQALAFIKTLSANPGSLFDNDDTEYLVPELRISCDDNGLRLFYLGSIEPEIIFADSTYQTLIASSDTEVHQYIQHKYREYTDIVTAMRRRKETLIMIMRQIMIAQYQYFTKKDVPLAPLLLRDVAQKLQINESTVSRAIRHKYVQTPRGVLPLKVFFSKYAVQGDYKVSVDTVQKKIAAMVAEEDKQRPLSDNAISMKLTQLGWPIARRTVAKYREQLDIPSARRRRDERK